MCKKQKLATSLLAKDDDGKSPLPIVRTKRQITLQGLPNIDAINLVSQTMHVRIDIFDCVERTEDGKKLFRYRFIAKDTVPLQCIDMNLEDTTGEYGINLLCEAFTDNSLENAVSTVYSWGQIEFSFGKHNGNTKMMIFAYIDGFPDENDGSDALHHNYIYMEFNESEFEKFKYFIFALNTKANEPNP